MYSSVNYCVILSLHRWPDFTANVQMMSRYKNLQDLKTLDFKMINSKHLSSKCSLTIKQGKWDLKNNQAQIWKCIWTMTEQTVVFMCNPFLWDFFYLLRVIHHKLKSTGWLHLEINEMREGCKNGQTGMKTYNLGKCMQELF